MKNKEIICFNKFLLITLLISESVSMCFGQPINNLNKEKAIKNMTDNVKALFYYSDCTYGPLVNGKLYTDYYPGLLGHQYLYSKVWEKGVVYFRNDVEKELLINYDIVSDKLLFNKFCSDGVYCIELNINDVKGFFFNGHEFIKVTLIEGSKEISGYYELIYDGKVKLLLKWEKYISKASDINKDIAYLEKTLYIKNNNKLVKVYNRKSLISSLADQARNIENYLKQNKFYVRTAALDDFVKLMVYYESL